MSSTISEQLRLVDRIARPLRIRNAVLALYDAILLSRNESLLAARQLDRATRCLVELVGPSTANGVIEALTHITERSQLVCLEQALIDEVEIASTGY